MKVNDGDVLDFQKALREAQCYICGSGLEWDDEMSDLSAVEDHFAYCCRTHYIMTPNTVSIQTEKVAEDSE